METQLLKVGYEVVHADIKFTLVDEFGNDYRPIARALLNQGDMYADSLSLPHLLLREDHIVSFLEWLAGRLCCKKSGRDAMDVKAHLPVQLRRPLQTGWR
jgi:hypothetical protein